MTDTELHDRLTTLAQKIAACRAHLEQSEILFKEHHHLTGKQLDER